MIIEGILGVKLAKIAVIGLKRKSMKHYSWQTGGQVKLCFCISIFWKLLLALFCFLLLTYKRYLINSDSFSIAILNCSERKFSCYTILISIFMMFFLLNAFITVPALPILFIVILLHSAGDSFFPHFLLSIYFLSVYFIFHDGGRRRRMDTLVCKRFYGCS